jgi:hypothetical protein
VHDWFRLGRQSVSEITLTDAQILARWAAITTQLNPMTHDMAGRFVEWARLSRRNENAVRAHFPTWCVTHGLVEAAARYAEERIDVLKLLLDQSDARLDPLHDPLRITFSLHRWMADDREEAYSDWLAWVLTELASPERIGRVLFGDSIPEQLRYAKEPCLVERETPVPEGHEGHSGRLDCVLQFGREAVIVIEVKLTNADATDTAKQVGYSRWLNDQQVCFKKALLLATGGKGEDYYTFTLLRWKDVCQRLRRLLPELCCEHEIITAALIAGFIGAVEQNLLGVPSLSWIDKYRNDRRSAALQFIDRIDAATEYVQGTLA